MKIWKERRASVINMSKKKKKKEDVRQVDKRNEEQI